MKNTQKIALFDTSIASDNLGDGIIIDAVTKSLNEIYPKQEFAHFPTHIPLSSADKKIIKNNDLAFVGGTNILCANWLFNPQWKIGFYELFKLPETVLMGVGWKFYQRPTDFITAIFLRRLLSKKYLHSVRDSYTKERLEKIGINNVINTACPTMWSLTPEHCADIPKTKAKNVMITVTAYRHEPELDKKWLEIVLANYDRAIFWPQMDGDEQYIKDMNLGKKVEVLEPTLVAYDNALKTEEVDFIGTRLHGGIRALQHKRRTLIIEVDNRAVEIARDTNLPTVKRDDIEKIKRWINSDNSVELLIPWNNIVTWKQQFAA